MKWFTGEVSIAIQKAIQEKKVFIVFVKDEKEDSTKMEEIWNDDQVTEVCTEEKCVAINIASLSTPGQQFGAIYPILCVPTTYLINNQGTPTDIIPGVIEKDEFTKRLKDGIEKTLLSAMGGRETPSTAIVEEPISKVNEMKPAALSNDQPGTSSEAPISNSNNLAEDIETTEQVTKKKNEEPTKLEDDVNGEYDEELTTQEQSQLSMLKEKVRVKIEDYEKQLEEDLKADYDEELTTQEQSQLSMLEEKLVRVNKEEYEKQKLKDTEKKRREIGKDLQDGQRSVAEKQARELAAEIANRKSEDKAAREKVKEQIRLDRLEKTRKFDTEKKEREEVMRKKVETAGAQAEKKKTDNSNTTRLQFRLPDGSAVSNQFNADAKFLLAESFIKGHLQSTSVRLSTVYPKHEFDSEDMLKSFRELGLVPNASIIVSSVRELTSSTSLSFDPMSFIMFILAPIFAVFAWIASLFTGNSSNASQPAQRTESSQQTQSSSRNDTVHRRNLQTNSPRRSNNMNRLRREDDDDENATWNGNSTQQM